MFGLSRRHHRPDDFEDLDDQIIVWTLQNGTDFHDFSPAQIERRRLYVRAANQGLDANRVAYVKWLHSNARISDAAITDPAVAVRERAGVGVPVPWSADDAD